MNGKRGRPTKHIGILNRHIVAMIRSDLAAKRSASLVAGPLSISMPTLLKVAARAGLQLKRGRPRIVETA